MEQQISTYLENCNLTDEFFCKYDPDKEYVMQFETIGDNETRPCCKVVESRQIFEERQGVLLDQLYHVQDRIVRYQKLVEDVLDDTQKQAPLKYAFPDTRAQFDKLVTELNVIGTEIVHRLHLCFEPIFSEGVLTLIQMTNEVCQPMEAAVNHIESAFFPRLFEIESLVTTARLNKDAADKQGEGLYVKFVGVLKAAYASIKNVARTIRLAVTYIYTYAIPNFRQFVRVGWEPAKVILQNICDIKEDKDIVDFYNSIYTFIFGNAQTDAMITTLKNRFKIFCNKRDQKLLVFIMNTVSDFLENEKDVVQIDANKVKPFTYFKDLIHTIREDMKTMLDRTCVFTSGGMTKQQCVYWLWLICIYGLELFRSVVGYARTLTCAAASLFLSRIARNDPSTQEQKEVKANEPADVDAKSDLDQIALLPFEPAVKTYFKDKVELVQSLFKFFWFFTKNNFVPKEDTEADLEKYIKDPSEFNSVNSDVGNVKRAHRTVPTYVRYAYCLSQQNTPQDCNQLLQQNKPIMGLANPAERYADYIAREKERLRENEVVEVAQQPTEEDIREVIEQTSSKLHQTASEDRMLQAVNETRRQLGYPPITEAPRRTQDVVVTTRNPVITTPVITTPVVTTPVVTTPVVTTPVVTTTPATAMTSETKPTVTRNLKPTRRK